MEAALVIYAISLAGNLKTILEVVLILSSPTLLLYFIVYLIDKGELPEKWKVQLASLSILGIVFAAIPSEKTSHLMVAGYLTQQAVQSEHAKELSKAILKKLEEFND